MGKFYESIIHISDLQEPFSHPDSYNFLAALKSRYWINSSRSLAINAGDEADFHAMQRKYPIDPDGYSAGTEWKKCKESLKPLWSLFPKQRICTSNHLMRPWITALNSGLPRGFLRSYGEILGAPKDVLWQDRWVFNNIVFEHGENVSGANAALNAAVQNMMSTAIGHQHGYGGVVWTASFHKTIFGLNSGCLIDQTKYAFKYSNKARKKVTLGSSVILDNVPFFIPMLLDDKGRWVGRLPD